MASDFFEQNIIPYFVVKVSKFLCFFHFVFLPLISYFTSIPTPPPHPTPNRIWFKAFFHSCRDLPHAEMLYRLRSLSEFNTTVTSRLPAGTT
jgi:hypothetical protein